MHDNISDYFNDILSKFQCGFQKGFSAQTCLLYMIETIRKIRDNPGMFAAVMTDLSKAFDCISHKLLIAKLNAYGFDETSLKVIISYLKNRMQTTKVGSSFSELSALSRASKYMTFNKRRILMKSFIFSQFNYCPLIWIIHNRGLNKKTNHKYERVLRIVYDDYSSSFEDLLNKDKSVTINVTFNNWR